MRMSIKLLLGTVLFAASAGLWSCTTGVTCGEGTIEMDGKCTATGDTPGGSCGAGSTFNQASGQCEFTCPPGKVCGICGPNTVDDTDDAGVHFCRGTGVVPTACDVPIDCPSPGPNKFMMCGQILDTETTAAVSKDNGADPKGKLKVSFYDALAFAMNPAVAPLLTVTPDDCGRFASFDGTHAGVSVPSTSFIAIGTDDQTLPFGMGDFATTGIGVAGVQGGKLTGIRAYSTRNATDAKWSVGLAGASFATRGVYLAIFIDTRATPVPPFKEGAPMPGITLVHDGSTSSTGNDDFYFNDTDPLLRAAPETATPGSKTATGPNGAALWVNSQLVEFSGTPNPGACTWPSTLAATLAGAVFVQERLLECP